MTVIRFSRRGTKKRPVFRLVVQTKTAARDGKFIENLGNFFPLSKDHAFSVDRQRLQYWLGVGAQPSTSVTNHLRSVFAQFRSQASGALAPTPEPIIPAKGVAESRKKEIAKKETPKRSK